MGRFSVSKEAPPGKAVSVSGSRDSKLDKPEATYFAGAGVRIAADVDGPESGTPIVFLHGGGQTRAAWKRAVTVMAKHGYRAISLDLRGHGDSEWAPDSDYRSDRYVDDLVEVMKVVGRPAVYVGASLGGITSLLAVGEKRVPARALVLVDIAPQIDPAGAQKIGAFMKGNPNGFASLEEAADAVAAYLPHRPRPKNTEGLMKNLRRREDGRLYWHWDPKMLSDGAGRAGETPRLEAAARALDVPTLLIRGGLSQVISTEGAKAFLAIAPHAEFVDVTGADHMVAGDDNDAFNAAVIDFVTRNVR
jgi:non-heme chloroperoxidase